MSDHKNPGHNSKKDFLKNPVEHIDITSFDSRKIISSMEKMSFVSRETANAANIFNDMLKDKDCTIFLTLAGSTSAAGCMNIYKDLVKYNMVDAIIATGASIIEAPVATMASTMLYLTKSEYNFMQPAAEVDPAKVKKIEQFLSEIISLKIFAALAVSLDVKDIFSIESIIFRASKEVISMCSTVLFKSDFLLCPILGLLFCFIKRPSSLLYSNPHK